MMQQLENINKCNEIYKIHETATKSLELFEIVIKH